MHAGMTSKSARRDRPRDGLRSKGLTLVELIIAVTILSVLSLVAMPLARVQLMREKERELRSALRENPHCY